MNFKQNDICGLDYDTAMTMHDGGLVEVVIIYHIESWRTKILNLATIQVDRALRCLRVCVSTFVSVCFFSVFMRGC